jgi:hypothetical protein
VLDPVDPAVLPLSLEQTISSTCDGCLARANFHKVRSQCSNYAIAQCTAVGPRAVTRYVVAPVLAGSTSLAVLNDQSYAKQTYLNDDTLFISRDCFPSMTNSC